MPGAQAPITRRGLLGGSRHHHRGSCFRPRFLPCSHGGGGVRLDQGKEQGNAGKGHKEGPGNRLTHFLPAPRVRLGQKGQRQSRKHGSENKGKRRPEDRNLLQFCEKSSCYQNIDLPVTLISREERLAPLTRKPCFLHEAEAARSMPAGEARGPQARGGRKGKAGKSSQGTKIQAKGTPGRLTGGQPHHPPLARSGAKQGPSGS